jgi:hypothetical protein
MKVLINISETDFEKVKMAYTGIFGDVYSLMRNAITEGVELPEGAEILTKEAYSDLCMRASRAESEGENKKEKHTCISCRFYRYDRRTWPCDDCLDYDRWKEVEE